MSFLAALLAQAAPAAASSGAAAASSAAPAAIGEAAAAAAPSVAPISAPQASGFSRALGEWAKSPPAQFTHDRAQMQPIEGLPQARRQYASPWAQYFGGQR